jgi:hypothetical protein
MFFFIRIVLEMGDVWCFKHMLHVIFTANPSYPLLKSFENSLDIKATLGLLRFIFLSYSENSKRERNAFE